MRWPNWLRFSLMIPGLLCAVGAHAQADPEDIGNLPIAVANQQLESAQQLAPVKPPSPLGHVRRLPRPVFPLTPEEVTYREAVEKLGVNQHRFVHCELATGRVRTGVITHINDSGFNLKDGIFLSQWIPYTDLKAAPRAVPAIGTRIGQGFKWAGVGVGVAVAIPLCIVMLPLIATGAIAD